MAEEEKKFSKIIHVDMDAFFASVEQRDNPDLRGKPVAVGGDGRRGVVAAASYEARKYGVHSAMPGHIAKQKCPHIIFVRGSHSKYREVSNQIMDIFREYTDILEPLSLDEAFMDVTENKMDIASATIIAKEIRRKIFKRTGLTASAGVSFNKFLAKVASDYRKPNGLTVITPDRAAEFIDQLKIGKIPGIGKVTQEKMHSLKIYTGADLKKCNKDFLKRHFGKNGSYFYDLVRCKINSRVSSDRIRKSLGSERTFKYDVSDIQEMKEILRGIITRISKSLVKKDLMGKTVTLKIKYHDFVQQTRSKTEDYPIQSEEEIWSVTEKLLLFPVPPIKAVRLLGVQISNLDTNSDIPRQLSINFYDKEF